MLEKEIEHDENEEELTAVAGVRKTAKFEPRPMRINPFFAKWK